MNGTRMRLYVDLSGGTSYTAIGNSLDCTLNFTHSARETTNQDSAGHASFLEGKRVKTIDFNGLLAEDGANNAFDFYTVLDDETDRGFITCQVTGGLTGEDTFTYDGWITSLSISSGGPEGNVTFSGSIQVTGQGTTGTVTP